MNVSIISLAIPEVFRGNCLIVEELGHSREIECGRTCKVLFGLPQPVCQIGTCKSSFVQPGKIESAEIQPNSSRIGAKPIAKLVFHWDVFRAAY